MKTVTIHSNGYGDDVAILDEDGNQIPGVVSATIWLEAQEPNRVDLQIAMPKVIVRANTETPTFVCFNCEQDVEHDCGSTTLGGQQIPPPRSNPIDTYQLFKSGLCGETMLSGGRPLECFIDAKKDHIWHCDINEGMLWTFRGENKPLFTSLNKP